MSIGEPRRDTHFRGKDVEIGRRAENDCARCARRFGGAPGRKGQGGQDPGGLLNRCSFLANSEDKIAQPDTDALSVQTYQSHFHFALLARATALFLDAFATISFYFLIFDSLIKFFAIFFVALEGKFN